MHELLGWLSPQREDPNTARDALDGMRKLRSAAAAEPVCKAHPYCTLAIVALPPGGL